MIPKKHPLAKGGSCGRAHLAEPRRGARGGRGEAMTPKKGGPVDFKNVGETIGKPWENQENHGKMVISPTKPQEKHRKSS